MGVWTRRGLVLQGGLGAAAIGLASPASAGEATSRQERIYVCAPCGCAMDGLEFDGPGECPACGMALIQTPAGGSDDSVDWLPPQLEIAVLHRPTPFPAEGRHHLVYEVHLRNHGRTGLAIRALEVHDPDRSGDGPLAVIRGRELAAVLLPTGRRALAAAAPDARLLPEGGGAVSFLALSLAAGRPAPERMSHRVLLKEAAVNGPIVRASSAELRTFAPPIRGPDWVADGGPTKPSHHRFGLLAIDGALCLGRRHAIDWKRQLAGATFSGDPAEVRSYHCYGQPVNAVDDAIVVLATDGFPDNAPRTAAGFSPALPLSLMTIAGNAVVLDLGGGQYAHYAHLKPGSVRVQVGDRVRRRQVLGQIGNSGDSREPHLHFHVSDGPGILASEGLPYVLDEFVIHTLTGRESRKRELPLGDARIDFPAV